MQKTATQLREANAKLVEKDKTKSMFIASMSHELRTPLNSIIGFTGLLLQEIPGRLNGEQKKQLTMVKGSSSQLLSLINDVIDVSKIEADQIPLEIREFDLCEAAREVAASLEIAASEKGMKLAIKAPRRLVIESDPRRVKQIITNFMSNSIKYSQEGTVTLRISGKGGRATVSVADQGIGIREKDLAKLFQAFSRIREEGLVQPEGVGLGLYLSKKLATLLGGTVGASSRFGKGSEFWLVLPLKGKKGLAK